MSYESQYPPAQSDTYVKATSHISANFWPYFATDPSKSVIGDSNGNAWVSNLATTNQRFHIDLGEAKIIKRIYYENYHESGLYINPGAKNFTIWGSNDSDSFAELTYGVDTGWTQLTTEQSFFDQHIGSNIADPKYILITNVTAYRYYAFKFADCWNASDEFMGLRRVELQIETGGTISDDYLLQSVIKKLQDDSYIFNSTIKGLSSNFYLLSSTLLKSISSSYLLKACLVFINTGSYILNSVLFKQISDSYKFTANLLGNISNSFLLKCVLLKSSTNSYLLKAFISRIIRSLYLSYLTFDVYGTLTSDTEVGGARIITNPNILSNIYIYVKNQGASGTTIIDINKNGTSIYSNPADRPRIAYNDLNKFSESSVNIVLSKEDKITIDIDDVAVGASDLSVILHLDTYSGLSPVVNDVEFLDNTFIMDKDKVWITDDLRFNIKFDNKMNTSITPVIKYIHNDGTISNLTGSWSKSRMDNDTFLTDSLALDEDDVGLGRLIVKTATDKYNKVMKDYSIDFSIVSFLDKIVYDSYSNVATISLAFNIQANKVSFSLDGITYSSQTDLLRIMSVDITDISIGGTSSEGTKTLYVKLTSEDSYQYTIKELSIKYYYTAIGVWTGNILKKITAESTTNYITVVTLPESAKIVPISSIEVYQDSVLIKEDKIICNYVYNGLSLTYDTVNLRKVTISAGSAILDSGLYVTKSQTDFILDVLTSDARYDVICLDENGDFIVLKGVEGGVNSQPPYLVNTAPEEVNNIDILWPELPEIPSNYVPLYALLLTDMSEIVGGALLNLSGFNFDLRILSLISNVTLVEADNTTIRIQITDDAGRTSYKETILNLTTTANYSTKVLKAYADSAKTIEIKSGEKTTATTVYFDLGGDF